MPDSVNDSFDKLLDELKKWEDELPVVSDEEGYTVYHYNEKMIRICILQIESMKKALGDLG